MVTVVVVVVVVVVSEEQPLGPEMRFSSAKVPGCPPLKTLHLSMRVLVHQSNPNLNNSCSADSILKAGATLNQWEVAPSGRLTGLLLRMETEQTANTNTNQSLTR